MDNRKDAIKEALHKSTDEAVELKDMVWNNIEKELGFKNEKIVQIKGKKKKNIGFMKYGSIAAAIAVAIFSNTEYGHATANKIREIFVPNKSITQKLEGMDEDNNVTLKEGLSKYIIYIDDERYTMESDSGKDIIKAKAKAENYPEVFMEIEQVKGKNPEDLASEIQNTLKEKYPRVENKGKVTWPISSILISAYSGSNSRDTVIRYYFIDNEEGGTFVVKQQLFIEALEGHGVRLDNMLNEFKIVQE